MKLFEEEQFNDLKQFNPEWLLETAGKKFRTRNEFSAVKNGLKWLAKYDSALKLPTEEQFSMVSRKKRNSSKKPRKVIYLKPTQRKINQISDEKLRYAYRLAMVSGLRVSELAALKAEDITIKDGKIFIDVKHGKGGHGGLVECMQDDYLLKKLPRYLQEHGSENLFYSEAYMRECADKLGIECHDLRRIFAITTRNVLKKEMPVEEANKIVQQRLRHVRFSTTKRYLFNRKLKLEYEKVQENVPVDEEVKVDERDSSYEKL